MSEPRLRGTSKALLTGGLALFFAGALLAFRLLPEWRRQPTPEPARLVASFQELARRLGLDTTGRPKVRMTLPGRALEGGGRPGGSGSVLRIGIEQPLSSPSLGSDSSLRVEFSLDGRPERIRFFISRLELFRASDPAPFEGLVRRIEASLVRPGETLSPPLDPPRRPRPPQQDHLITPSDPPLRLVVEFMPPLNVAAERSPAGTSRVEVDDQFFVRSLLATGRVILILLVVFSAFFALLARRGLDVWNAVPLAALVLFTTDLTWIARIPLSAGPALATVLSQSGGLALWVLLTWSAGESLLRVSHPGFSTSLDNLRRGRLGPRGGRALLAGLGCGAGLAGLKLAFLALATVLPGLSPAEGSVDLPLFRGAGSPIADGVVLAAHALLAMGLATRFLPGRWVAPATALVLGGAFDLLPLHPGWAGFAAGAVLAFLLAWAGRRLGLTTLLVAAIVTYLLPATLFAAGWIDWMPGSFAVCAAALLAIGGFGFAGLARSEDRESEPLPQPAFMRRIEEERRILHEMELLARMQAGLTPREMPVLPGYEIMARSDLAGDAGGDLYDFLRDGAGALWIAAGDVAGHGYPCAVAQAMIKATLLSVIAPGETPDRVLHQTDRVLRRAHLPRRFSTLALLRLEPESGEIELSNAGHPYPYLAAERRLTEIELPGLPLGRGPERTYGLRRFTLPRGGLLVIYSDGLVETIDRAGRPYGFDRVREVVEVMANRPAREVVDALLNDGRRHLDGERSQDDITVLAIRRT